MIDVKKLISGFLILAAAAVGSGFILSFAGNFTPSTITATGPRISETGLPLGTSPTLGANAFVDTGSLQGNAAEMLSDIDTSSTAAVASDPNNLTNTFADSFLNGLVAANPDGASVDSSGNPNFSAPDAQAVSQALASDPTFQNFKAPDWDAEAAKIKIITTGNSSENIDNYVMAFNGVYQKYIGNTDIGGILGEENAADAQTITNQTQETLQTVAAIPTPSSMVGLQESFIKLLVYEKNSTQLISEAATDPLRSSLTFQDEQSKYDLAVTNFSTQWSRFSANIQSSALLIDPPQNRTVAFIDRFLDIPTANAQLVVSDPAVFGVVTGQLSINSAELGKTIEKYVEDIALQVTINLLTNLIQRKVLTWIQGSGAPRFVTDFGTQMVNSFQTAAINKLNSYMKCVPTSMTPSLKILLSTPSVASKNSCGAEFNGQLSGNNLANLQNHFTNFSDYLSLYSAGGNGFSVLMTANDTSISAGTQNAQAKQTQTVAQQGWKGSETCAQGNGDPNGFHYECQDGGTLSGSQCEIDSGGVTLDVDATEVQNLGQCNDGSNPTITSPGQTTGQGFFSSIKSGTENITSAKNLAGIFNALLSSVLNTLSQDAISFSNTELNNLENGTSGGGSDGGLMSVVSSSLMLTTSSSTSMMQCIPANQTTIFDASTSQATASFSVAGGTIDSTCAGNNNCPSTENSDGTPIYHWSAPGSLNYAPTGTLPVGSSFFTTYNATGTYFVTATASTDQGTSTCEVDVTTGQ
jgi:hypothetical protein